MHFNRFLSEVVVMLQRCVVVRCIYIRSPDSILIPSSLVTIEVSCKDYPQTSHRHYWLTKHAISLLLFTLGSALYHWHDSLQDYWEFRWGEHYTSPHFSPLSPPSPRIVDSWLKDFGPLPSCLPLLNHLGLLLFDAIEMSCVV